MDFKEFDVSELKETMKKYGKETEQTYGKTQAFKEFEEKTKNYTDQNWYKLNKDIDKIMLEFADVMDKGADSKEAQEQVKKWKDYVTQNLYECTDEILKGYAILYRDERFIKNIDKHRKGLAEFIVKAIEIYCK